MFPALVVGFMSGLRPRLDVGDSHFTHVEPRLNPEIVGDLWYYEGPPDERGKFARIFDAVPNRIMFAGHYHKWLIARPDGIANWKGDFPIRLGDGRYFVVIGALCEGRYEIFDTETSELVPYNET